MGLFLQKQVYYSVPELDRSLDRQDDEDQVEEEQAEERSLLRRISQYAQGTIEPWREYVRQPVFLASFALSLLYLTVLSFGPTMVTFLLHSGFSSLQVSGMRIGAVLAEISGTWVAPFLMDRIGPIRSGLWFLNWQFCTLAAAVAAFAFASDSPQLVAVSLIVGVALSRLGLWGFDLSVQFLVQEVCSNQQKLSFYCSCLTECRTSTLVNERAFQQRKWRCKACSRWLRLLRRLSSRILISSSIRCTSATGPLGLLPCVLRRMCVEKEGICYTRPSVWATVGYK